MTYLHLGAPYLHCGNLVTFWKEILLDLNIATLRIRTVLGSSNCLRWSSIRVLIQYLQQCPLRRFRVHLLIRMNVGPCSIIILYTRTGWVNSFGGWAGAKRGASQWRGIGDERKHATASSNIFLILTSLQLIKTAPVVKWILTLSWSCSNYLFNRSLLKSLHPIKEETHRRFQTIYTDTCTLKSRHSDFPMDGWSIHILVPSLYFWYEYASDSDCWKWPETIYRGIGYSTPRVDCLLGIWWLVHRVFCSRNSDCLLALKP